MNATGQNPSVVFKSADQAVLEDRPEENPIGDDVILIKKS